MAQIAYAREFNGSGDKIQLTATDYNTAIGAMSWVAIASHDTTGNRWIISAAGGTGGEWSLGHNASGTAPALWFEPTTANCPSAIFETTDGWCLIAVTRADGTSAPRYHRYRYSDSNWQHVDHGATVAETAALSGASVWIGSYNGSSEYWDGKVACIGVWAGTELSDGQLEGMTDDIASWEALTPTGLWLLDQASAATAVTDRVGAGDQTAITGTTAVAEATLAFDVGGEVARAYKRLTGPAQLTGSAADLYTCPASTVARILHIHASNPSGSPVDINLSIGADAAATRVFDDRAVPADGVLKESYPYELAAGEKIQGWADSAGTVVLTITGYEDPV